MSIETPGGELRISQRSSYPWEGRIELDFLNEKEVKSRLFIRIPGWAMDTPVPSDLFRFVDKQEFLPHLVVNGQEVELFLEKGYAVIPGSWKQGDRIILELAMEGRVIKAHEQVDAKTGLLAVQYGPLVYCAEEIDNEVDVLNAGITAESGFDAGFDPDLLGGVNILRGQELVLIPYYVWANREVGKMNVWFKNLN
jgi:DUF1680 family protein